MDAPQRFQNKRKMESDKFCFFEEINSNNNHQNGFSDLHQANFQAVLHNKKFRNFITTGYLENLEESDKLTLASSALLLFVQINFTGPDVLEQIQIDFLDKNSVSMLTLDGIDQIDPNFQAIELLCVAKIVMENLLKDNSDDLVINLWFLRLLMIHQRVLEDNSNSLYEKLLETIDKLNENLKQMPKSRQKCLISLEIIQSLLTYKRINKIEALIEEVKAEYGIETVVEGILGVRTKFQQKALPQLHLTVKQLDEDLKESPTSTHASTKLTNLLILDDEVRLEKIRYCSEEHNQLPELNSVIQNLLLIILKFLEISQPKDKLADEELQPYLTVLLNQRNGPWIIRLNSLTTNIKLESNHRRTVERSLRQCEELVGVLKKGEQEEAKQRLSYVFSSLLIPRYKIESQLADLMLSLGLIKAALEIYLKLQLWEEVISCYTILQLRHKAAEVINQELEKKPTVKLYCMLGDATDDVSCYEKAWEFSNFTSGRAQRHWGNYYFAKKEYEQAIPHLQKSLEINYLQEVTWLRLGYSALSLEKWEMAANAYVRYTQIESNGFESWNNLAKCYIKLNDKKRAHKILQEALKCNFNNWRVWENFLLVSIDIGSFEDAINAYERIMELKEKEKYFDEEILGIIVRAVEQNVPDANGNSAGRLKKKTIDLLARLTAQNPSQGVTSELSAMITDSSLLKAQKLQNAYRGYVSKNLNWSKDEVLATKMLNLCKNLCQVSLEACTNIEETDRMSVFSQLSSTRLTGQGCVKATSAEKYESCQDLLNELQSLVEQVTSKIKEIKP